MSQLAGVSEVEPAPPFPHTRWTPELWQALEDLGRQAGLADDRLSTLKRLESPPPQGPGHPVTLVAGCPDGGVERLVGALLGADVAHRWMDDADGLLVAGPQPQTVQPRLGRWPGHVAPMPTGHLILLRLTHAPSSGLEAQLASMGGCDQLLFVTRLGQPLNQTERRLLEALGHHAVTVRVLVSAVTGETASHNELAEVTVFAKGHLGRAGIHPMRRLGTAFWWSDGNGPDGALDDPAQLLTLRPDTLAEGRRALFGDALRRYLDDLETRLPADAPGPVDLAADERRRLATELETFLDDLERQLMQLLSASRPSDERLRRVFCDSIEAWTAHTSVEGHWLRYLERVRPGSEQALLDQVQEQAHHLRVDGSSLPLSTPAGTASAASVRSPAGPPRAAAPSPWFTLTQRAAVAAFGGLLGYVATMSLLQRLGGPLSGSSTLGDGLSVVGFGLAALLTYGLSGRWIGPSHDPSAALPSGDHPSTHSPITAEASTLLGWREVRHALLAWFAHRINTPNVAPRQRLTEIKERIGLPEEHA